MSINLSRWDLADEFTANEAACLMLGFDPHNPDAPTWAIKPILKRMRGSYQRTAIGIVLSLQEDKDSPEGLKVSNFMELMGRKLTFFYLETDRQSSDLRPSDEVITRLSAGFEQDTFRRPEIARWLSLFQIESKYQFQAHSQDANGGPDSLSPSCDATTDPEPHAQYETVRERIQREAKSTFFAPTRQRDPKREEVTQWIKDKLRQAGEDASDNVATAMFTIIKPADHNPKRPRN